jgi:hypothetical protein
MGVKLGPTLREKHRLWVFGNKVLRISEPKVDEVTGGWRKHPNQELHNLYSLPYIIRVNKSRKLRWAGEENCIQGMEGGKGRRNGTIRIAMIYVGG